MLCEAVDERGEWRKLGSVRGSRDQESQREADKESRQGGLTLRHLDRVPACLEE